MFKRLVEINLATLTQSIAKPRIEHELKLARMASDLAGTRAARSTLWSQMQQQLADKCSNEVKVPTGKAMSHVENFRPICALHLLFGRNVFAFPTVQLRL